MTIQLYEDTPVHTENFIKLATNDYYQGLLFHRVIKNFMIQTGDHNSKDAKAGDLLGRGGKRYTLPAEIKDKYFHKKGAIAAARQPDQVNPQKKSSGSQFYIVHGQKFTDEQLNMMEIKNIHDKFTKKERQTYKSIGGAPHLDDNYTIFGEVIDGYHVIDKIANLKTDKNDRPFEDVIIKDIKILE
jgi:peptidyl-prolyl cis-trans isomerase B (cyclophilin B)